MIKLFLKFSIVGVSGVLVNMVIYTALIFMKIDYTVAATVSFLFAVTNNFYWNFIWTFKNKAQDKSLRRKYAQFFLISAFNFVINLAVLNVLMKTFFSSSVIAHLAGIAGVVLNDDINHKVSAICSQIVAIGIASILNFFGNYAITFREKKVK